MIDVRSFVGKIFLAVITCIAVILTWRYSITLWLYDHEGRYWGTFADWVNNYLVRVLHDPVGMMFYSGWGPQYPRLVILGVAIVLALWFVGRTAVWRKYFPECVIIDCNKDYLFYLIFGLPFLLTIFGVGASMNLYWDYLLKTPFLPWHEYSHKIASIILFSLAAPIDYEGIFRLKYRFKFYVMFVCAWIASMMIEIPENLMVLQYGLRPDLSNYIVDSLPVDHKAVLEGMVWALLIFNGLRYRQ